MTPEPGRGLGQEKRERERMRENLCVCVCVCLTGGGLATTQQPILCQKWLIPGPDASRPLLSVTALQDPLCPCTLDWSWGIQLRLPSSLRPPFPRALSLTVCSREFSFQIQPQGRCSDGSLWSVPTHTHTHQDQLFSCSKQPWMSQGQSFV